LLCGKGRITQPNCFHREAIAKTAERATDAREAGKARKRTILLCCHSLELREIEAFLFVLGALCGSTATFGLSRSRDDRNQERQK